MSWSVSVLTFNAGFFCERSGKVSSSDSGPSATSIGARASASDASKNTEFRSRAESLSVGDSAELPGLGFDSSRWCFFDMYSFSPLCFWRGSMAGSSAIGHSGPQYVTSGRVESSVVENFKLNFLLQASV